jgi:restriction endonuclease S subunit
LKATLKDIAQLSSGIYTKPDFEGDVYYVQAKHFNSDGEFDFSVKPDLRLEGKIEKHLLKTGDILLAVKGNNNFAVQYKGLIKNAVASSTFIVIRLRDQSQVLPEFLNWYLNHPQTQLFFKDQSKGSAIASISISSIEDLELFIPVVEIQRIILNLTKLRQREKKIRQQLTTLRENYIQQQLLDSIKN